VPETLKQQLAGCGRLVVPVGRHIHQTSVVLLGEATHGTTEFYDARAAITEMLVQSTASTSSRSRPIGRTQGRKSASGPTLPNLCSSAPSA
jgi:protein-L-isoaspartate O-methyltransferase